MAISDITNTIPQLEEILNNKLEPFDVVIIGGGPAGLTAGLYCARAKMRTLLIERALLGGKVSLCSEIENYPGFPSGITGSDLARRLEDQAVRFGLEVMWGDVTGVKTEGDMQVIELADRTYLTKTIIIASGSEPKKLNVPGEDELRGRGVSYCAICDGAFYTDKKVIVVGGGNSAISEAIFLTRYALEVGVVHRRSVLRAERVLANRADMEDKIFFVWDSVIGKIVGTEKVEAVEVKNVVTGEKSVIPTDGVFIYIGDDPNTKLFKGLMDMDADGSIIVNDNMETSLKGVFAAGDVRKKTLRQIATAVGDGAVAADSARKFVENML